MDKSDFPIFERYPDLVYLDSAATTLKPKKVIEALSDFYSYHYANVHRGTYRLSEEATEMFEKARESIAHFLGASPEQIIFTKNATESLNMAISFFRGLPITISIYEHNSVFVPAQQYSSRLKIIESLSNIYHKEEVLAITGASNVVGKTFDIKEARDLSHNLIVDGTQYVQHFNPKNIIKYVDFFAFSGHKIYGPTGIGVLYIKDPEEWEPLLYGGGAVDSVSIDMIKYAPSPYKYEPGTPPIAEAWALKTAIELIDYEIIQERERALMKLMEQEKDLLEQYSIYPISETEYPQLSFQFNFLHHHDIAHLFDKKGNIAVRTGFHCTHMFHQHIGARKGTVRASFNPYYNDKNDFSIFIKTFRHIVEEYGHLQ